MDDQMHAGHRERMRDRFIREKALRISKIIRFLNCCCFIPISAEIQILLHMSFLTSSAA